MKYANRLRMVTHQTYNGTYSISNTCASSSVWKSSEPRLRIATFVIFLPIFIWFLVQWLLIRRRSKQAKETLFISFSAAVGFMILNLVLAIIADIGYGCYKISPRQYSILYIAIDCSLTIANLLIMFILLFTLTLTLLRHNFFEIRIPRIINIAFLCGLTFVGFASVAVSQYNASRRRAHSVLEIPFVAGYVVLYSFGTLMVAGYFGICIRTMRRYPKEYNAHLKWTLPALSLSVLTFAILQLIECLTFFVANTRWTKGASLAFLILELIFQAISYETLLMVAGSDTFSTAGEKKGIAQQVLFGSGTGGLERQLEWETGARRIKTDDGFMARTRERSGRSRMPPAYDADVPL